MDKQSTIGFIVLVTIAVTCYTWAIVMVNRKPELAVSGYKAMDAGFTNTSDSTALQKEQETANKLSPLSMMKSRIILLIDSLKQAYETIRDTTKPLQIPIGLQSDTKRLLQELQEFNRIKSAGADSRSADTISYWQGVDRFDEQNWLAVFFENASREVSITYLNYLKNQVMTKNP
jgi:hypothetical protein